MRRPPVKIVCAWRGDQLWMFCPGCEALHAVNLTRGINTDDPDKPRITPSILSTTGAQRCHAFVNEGSWNYLADCTHALAGQRVPMVPLPEWFVYQDQDGASDATP